MLTRCFSDFECAAVITAWPPDIRGNHKPQRPCFTALYAKLMTGTEELCSRDVPVAHKQPNEVHKPGAKELTSDPGPATGKRKRRRSANPRRANLKTRIEEAAAKKARAEQGQMAAQLYMDLCDSKKEKDAAVRELNGTRSELSDARSELDAVVRQRDAAVREHQADAAEKAAWRLHATELRGQLEALRAGRHAAQALPAGRHAADPLAARDAKISGLEGALARAEGEREAARSDLAACLADSKAAQRVRGEDLDTARSELAASQSDQQRLRGERDVVRGELAAGQSEQRRLRRERDVARGDATRVRGERDSARSELAASQSEQRLLRDRLGAAESERDAARGALEPGRVRVAALEGEVQDLLQRLHEKERVSE